MENPTIIPKIIWIGFAVIIAGAFLATGAYYFETSVLKPTNGNTPLFTLFSDAFKVGLGAFIGVLSQWANRVFKQADDENKLQEQMAKKSTQNSPASTTPKKAAS